MSLFGAMTSGVSALTAQSSAMGAISDNISNVNTVGYKGTEVDFQTLVTAQASNTMYAAGGVQSSPSSSISLQGLLQSSTSQTDLAISGNGFFVVNASSEPTIGDQFLYTRAGSFTTDSEGYLRNTAGYYLQGWPTDEAGNVILPADSTAAMANQNIISTDFLETINLNRVGGTATATSEIAVGANLPADDEVGDMHGVDVQFFDTLGNTNAVAIDYTKSAANEWEIRVEPPAGSSVLTLYNDANQVYQSIGQLEFDAIPNATEVMTIDGAGNTITFVNGVPAAGEVRVDGRTLGQVLADVVTEINGIVGSAVASTKGSNTILIEAAAADIVVDPNTVTTMTQTAVFTVAGRTAPAGPAITFDSTGIPSSFGATQMEILDLDSGAADMDGSAASRVSLNFGTVGEANGLTQFGGEFVPSFIEQNGTQFGVFSGVTVSTDGVMSALFDNGERRAIYKLPVATFVNPDSLQSQTGNAWNATEDSGQAMLREGESGSAGQVIQSSLESSTVDIGTEFTKLIVVQRAYSAATRVISTADEMLDELIRVKR